MIGCAGPGWHPGGALGSVTKSVGVDNYPHRGGLLQHGPQPDHENSFTLGSGVRDRWKLKIRGWDFGGRQSWGYEAIPDRQTGRACLSRPVEIVKKKLYCAVLKNLDTLLWLARHFSFAILNDGEPEPWRIFRLIRICGFSVFGLRFSQEEKRAKARTSQVRVLT
jgi:hypothetical protein